MQIYYNEKIFPIKRIEFTTLSSAVFRNRSVFDKNGRGIIISDLYDNGEPKKESLIDTNMGVTSKEYNCTKCGLSTTYCNGHDGHIKLVVPMYNLIYFETVIKIIRCFCPECSKLIKYNDNIISSMKGVKKELKLSKYKELVKNEKYCSYCNNPLPKIKPDKKTLKIILEYNKTSSDGTLKTEKEEITNEKVYKILCNISTKDITFLGINGYENPPKNFMFDVLPVPPVQIRPSVRGDFISAKEDSLTIILNDIVKKNEQIYKIMSSITESNKKNLKDSIELLQLYIGSYIDNESVKSPRLQQNNMPLGSLTKRLKGKKGRIRDNLMGKRTNFSARTVITPDPTLKINELGIPVAIAKNMTFPEIVTPENIYFLKKLVKNGRKNYPGANYVMPANDINSNIQKTINLGIITDVEINYGDTVERHILDGDIVLFNRQPTLHKQSMMGHYAKVIDNPDYNTFRMNPNVCPPYNGDFDKHSVENRKAEKVILSSH